MQPCLFHLPSHLFGCAVRSRDQRDDSTLYHLPTISSLWLRCGQSRSRHQRDDATLADPAASHLFGRAGYPDLPRAARVPGLRPADWRVAAVGESSVILLHPSLSLAGVSIGKERVVSKVTVLPAVRRAVFIQGGPANRAPRNQRDGMRGGVHRVASSLWS